MQSKFKFLRILPVLVCRKGQVAENFMNEKLEQLEKNLTATVEVLKGVIVNEEEDVKLVQERVAEADAILLYKPNLGLGNCIVNISGLNCPIILFNEEGMVNNPLDALEYIHPREKTRVAVDYQDLNDYLGVLLAKKKLEHTKILILNADFPHWEKFICRVSGGWKTVKEKLGIKLGYVKSKYVIERWKKVRTENVKPLIKAWIKDAERIVEPEEKELIVVAKLYIVMKDLLKEKNADAITMAYGESPLPVPCFAYTNLRDEGIPSACEADIISLLSMIILHYIANKPSFMGNTFVDKIDETLVFSHCVCPRKMEGYYSKPVPYTLRRYHKEKFTGSLTAFVKMKVGKEVTICRLSGNLKTMLLTKGMIVDCMHMDADEYCRVKVKVKTKNPKEFIHKTSGNHHVMVHGDYRDKLKMLNDILGIATIEV